MEKVNQLDEDTDAGVEMLEMAHNRERNLRKELEEMKKKVLEIEEVEKENNLVKAQFNFVKEKLENCFKENQKLVDTRNAENDTLGKYEVKQREHNIFLQKLQAENSSIKQKCDDLTEERESQKSGGAS